MARKKYKSRPTWTVAFLNREGAVLEMHDGQRAIRQQGTEQEITREVEDLMNTQSRENVGLPSSTCAAFIMKGDVYDDELASTKPRFIVHEGGHTTVVS